MGLWFIWCLSNLSVRILLSSATIFTKGICVKSSYRCFPLSVFSSQSLNLRGRRGTTDDIATIPLQPSLSSAALRESPNFIPTHSISSSVFLSFLLLSLSPAELSLHAGGSWAIPSEFSFLHIVSRDVNNRSVRLANFVTLAEFLAADLYIGKYVSQAIFVRHMPWHKWKKLLDLPKFCLVCLVGPTLNDNTGSLLVVSLE